MHVYALEEVNVTRPSIVTVGVFDGVHLGHQFLIERLVSTARERNQNAVVLTFFPHPDAVLKEIDEHYYLTHPDERARLLIEMGVDIVISHPFNDNVRQMQATEFVNRLLKHLQMSALWATANFALGYQREGNIKLLREQGMAKGFSVETVELVHADENGDKISSTTIRQAILGGDVTRANRYLGRYFCLSGEVVHGENRGHQIGFPTANVAVWNEHIRPQNGVYACWAYLGEERLTAVTNVGKRPTFDGKFVTIEAHLLNFNRDIYGEILRLEFVQRLRGEMKFNGIAELVAQIKRDVTNAETLLNPKSD